LYSWLERKSVQCGFNVKKCTTTPPIATYFRKKGKAGKHVSVDFQGIISVANRTLFQEAFSKGIGPARAFGFGMLMLQPIS
jgi:CRISPR system Cascade subunit CasE